MWLSMVRVLEGVVAPNNFEDFFAADDLSGFGNQEPQELAFRLEMRWASPLVTISNASKSMEPPSSKSDWSTSVASLFWERSSRCTRKISSR